MKRLFKSLIILLSILCFINIFACSKKEDGQLATKKLNLIHELEFGGIYITMTIEDFNALGFDYGDSLDITFSNGYKLEDIPYYNGYYASTGYPLLVAYKGYDYIKACIYNGDDLWVLAGVNENDTATISLHQKYGYLTIQNTRNIHYSDDREAFPSDEVFANFRSIKTTNLKENTLYRSASACDNQHNRATYVDKLAEEANINVILDLADTDEKIQSYINDENFNSPYFLSLYEKGNVIPNSVTTNYDSKEFKTKLVNGLVELLNYDGPYLIHCTEGKDRTGFVCMLLEALVGASYDEIVDDYMISYKNYYDISTYKHKDKYNVIVSDVLKPMICTLASGCVDVTKVDLSMYATRYLSSGGMSDEQIDALKEKLMK